MYRRLPVFVVPLAHPSLQYDDTTGLRAMAVHDKALTRCERFGSERRLRVLVSSSTQQDNKQEDKHAAEWDAAFFQLSLSVA